MNTPFAIAQQFIGVKEIPGHQDHPLILQMLKLDCDWPEHDEVPWCSAFVNYCCKEAGVERSHKLNARSWMTVGNGIQLAYARPGYDVIILSRPPSTANGHVGFYAGMDAKGNVLLLGGNQGDKVCIAAFDNSRIIGVRRLTHVLF